MDFDAIVIGSGFGGAWRPPGGGQLHEVVILERGRRWDRANYPGARATCGSGTTTGRSARTAGWIFASSRTCPWRRERRWAADR